MSLDDHHGLVQILDAIVDAESVGGERMQWVTPDDYGNDNRGYAARIPGFDVFPGPDSEPKYTHVVELQHVIGGSQIVWLSSGGTRGKAPAPNGDPFGPIDSRPDEVKELWNEIEHRLS
ncbi:hypothetical protein MUG78_17825 [Gordonia alkaliphila]|uniref:hypothetical protein n=1 Tax=Gordonia alkaliphila TaxID=1053547 RepID=UPI001FF3B4B6|nr:hypothetical protein [Gordonia alkaliphila]MCK0441261.1 hypothetical protein [Gordonia alkaliphila]